MTLKSTLKPKPKPNNLNNCPRRARQHLLEFAVDVLLRLYKAHMIQRQRPLDKEAEFACAAAHDLRALEFESLFTTKSKGLEELIVYASGWCFQQREQKFGMQQQLYL